MKSDLPEFLTPKQVCAMIGRSYRWLFEARREPGKGPPGFKIGGRYSYRPREVESWMEEKRVGIRPVTFHLPE